MTPAVASATTLPPSLSMAFGAASIPKGQTTTLTFTLSNPNGTALSGVGFDDTLPSGLQDVNSVTDDPTTTCNDGGEIEFGASLVAVLGAGLAANETCTVTFTVEGTGGGNMTNTSTAITSNEGGTGNSASASIDVVDPPTLSASFAPSTIAEGGISTLTFTLTNPAANDVPETGVAVTDTLPTGLVVATSNELTNSCGGSATATPGSVAISLSGATIGTGSACTVAVDVTGAASGGYTDTTGAPSSTNGGTGITATGTLVIAAPPTLTDSFSAPKLATGGSVGLAFTITNPNPGTGLSGVGFTDSLPSGLVIASPSGLTGSCGGGTITATPGSSSIALTGGVLAGSAQCTFAVSVVAVAAGVYDNTSGVVGANQTGPGNPSNTASVSAVAQPIITASFGASPIPLASTTSLTLTLTNADISTTLVNASVTDTLPSGLVVANPNGLAGTCLPGGSVSAPAGSGSIGVTSATLTPGASCTVVIDVSGTGPGSYDNTTGSIAATFDNGTGTFVPITGDTASDSLQIDAPPRLASAFSPAAIAPAGTSTLTYTVTNPADNPNSATGVAFSDSLPAGLEVATPNGLTGSCNGGTATATAGSQIVSLTGGSLASGASCTISVSVTAAQDGDFAEQTTASSTDGGTGAPTTAHLLAAAPPTLGAGFSPASVPAGGTSTLTFAVQNPNPDAPITGIGFTDALPSGLSIANPSSATGTCGGGTLTAAPGNATIAFSGGALSAGGSCTLSVSVQASSAGIEDNGTGAVTYTGVGTGAGATAKLTVLSGPSISISSPTSGDRFTLGQKVTATYSCADDVNGPGIASCVGTSVSGAGLDTTTLGAHTFTVTATSADGEQTTTTVDYTVGPTTNHFKVTHLVTHPDGTVEFKVTLPGPGSIAVLETAWDDNFATIATLLQPAPYRFAFSRKSVRVLGARTLSITVKPNARGVKLVKYPRYKVRIRLWVTYTPTGGRSRSVGFYGLRITP
jgi:uncharacterized repeat protein (TIGR01451 family)